MFCKRAGRLIFLEPACVVLVSCFLSLVPIPSFAAEISFEPTVKTISSGQQFDVGVFIDTGGEEINAVQGEIIFPQNLVETRAMRDGNSIVNFWIEKPKRGSEGRFAFSGIIPGGYSGSRGLVFGITFRAKQEGAGAIEFTAVKILRNDGKGTEAKIKTSNFQFLISNQITSSQNAETEIKDVHPPEDFAPHIAADPAIFEGRWFLVFAAQDKGSGIDHYEVCEGGKKCLVAESPYLLHNQSLDAEIEVKAIDEDGNERVVSIPPQKSRAWYKNYGIIGILLLAAFVYLVWKVLWKWRRK